MTAMVDQSCSVPMNETLFPRIIFIIINFYYSIPINVK